jgi:predicted nucleotidyltransferase
MIRKDKIAASTEIEAVKHIILETVDCEQIYLFGSYAYGTPNKDSDYDFYVVLKDGNENPLIAGENIFWNLRNIKRKTPVDILTEHISRFNERAQFNTLENVVRNEGVVLYDRNKRI